MLVLSLVIGPPDGPCLLLSLRVRSGLIACQLCPSLLERNSTWAAMNRSLGLSGATTIGNVHWKRYLRFAAPQPIGLSGQALIVRSCPVRWSYRVMSPSSLPAETMSGSSGLDAIQP